MAATTLLIPFKEHDQVYPNTQVPTQLNTSPKRVNASE